MCRFVESIKLENGVFYKLNLHQERITKAMTDYFPTNNRIDLEAFLSVQSFPKIGKYKCRIIYDSRIQLIEFIPYQTREIKTLKLVEINLSSYAYKHEERTTYNTAFSERGNCDDVLLIRNGLLTDTSCCNIALYDGKNWFTPHFPLIYGINRASLLSEKKIVEKNIKIEDIYNYKQIALFNAMIDFGEIIINTNRIS